MTSTSSTISQSPENPFSQTVFDASRRLGWLGLLWCFCGFLLGGCATSSRVIVGNTRPPIDPASVKLYLTPPEHYEEVAMITADSDGSWTFSQQAKMEEVIKRLKAEAAAVGANGILMKNVQDRSEDPVIITDEHDDWSTGFGFSEQEKSAWAIAIYVPEDETESLFSLLSRSGMLGRDTIANAD